MPADWERALAREPHEVVLRRAGFSYEGRFQFSTEHEWTVETLIGFTYSTSFLNRSVLGDRVDEFERDLRERLLACDSRGIFQETASWAYELGRLPS